MPHGGYKQKKGLVQLNELVDALKVKAEWLELGEHEELGRSSDHAFDAVVTAITVGAAPWWDVDCLGDAHGGGRFVARRPQLFG